MGGHVELTASDGHRLGAYRAQPHARRRAGLVVMQEFYGLNDHIRSVCERFATKGFDVVSPVLYHRIDRRTPFGPTIPYDEASIPMGREMRAQVGWENALKDTEAAISALSGVRRVGVVGYCWGGTMAWFAASHLPVACAVGYYGGQIDSFLDRAPRCPVMLHFGEADPYISLDRVRKVEAAHPEVSVFRYPGAGHGFNCDDADDYHAESATKAEERTLSFLEKYLFLSDDGGVET